MKKNIKKIFKKIYKISYKLINNPNIEWVFYLRYIFHKKLDIKINDFKIRFSTKDIIAKKWFFPRYLNGEPHEPPVTQQLIKEFESDSIFFDIGANIGFFTILAQKKCNKGSVHAFEIDPELVKIINNNTKLNQGAEVFINCSAITKKTQDIISFNPQKDNNKSTNSIYDRKQSKKQTIQVPTLSIDNYCSLTGFYPEIIKIDVEGAELDVLKGSKEVLNKNKLNTIFLELHPMFFKESKKETILKQINELLNSFQFYKFSHHRNKNKNSLEKINSLTEIKKNRMILCKR